MTRQCLIDIAAELAEPFSMADAVKEKLDVVYEEYSRGLDRNVEYLLRRNTAKVMGNIKAKMERDWKKGR